jgi:hypothetical protein
MKVYAMFCAACGQRLDRGDRFCRNCAAPVSQEPIESAIADSPPEPAPPAVETRAPAPGPEHTVAQHTEPEYTEPVVRGALPFGGYLDDSPDDPDPSDKKSGVASGRWSRKTRRLPVLETLMVVLLLVGAGLAVWMLRSSLPAKIAGHAANVEVTISPASANVAPGKTVALAASVSGSDNVELIWSVQEGDAGGTIVANGAKAEGGTVASLAEYTAPATPGTYHVVATSNANKAKSAQAEITVAKAKPTKPAKSRKR